jgi:GTP cyclohydrolase II
MPHCVMAKMEKALSRLEEALSIYNEIESAYPESSLVNLENSFFFERVIALFGPCLPAEKSTVDLRQIFDVAFHGKSRALIIANKGVTFASLTPFTSLSYITRHIACSLYHPNLGLETINIGISGNIYEEDVIVRAESACPPSFLFASQRCNCSYQWASVRELAAHFNPIDLPHDLSGDDLERWVEGQFTHQKGKHLPLRPGRGLIMMHLDSQAGMGAGYTENEFVLDLYNRASMRQLAENTAAQVYQTSIKKGYAALGLAADPRKECGKVGYQIPAIVLDWLGCNRQIILLSNNPSKLEQFEKMGFAVNRVKSLGKISAAGKREALQRGEDFQHLDMDGQELTFDEEIHRLKAELPL